MSKYVIREITPGAWTLTLESAMGVARGRSTYASAEDAADEARRRDPDAKIEIIEAA